MDPEDPDAKGFDFTDESIRKGFIKKVYSILTVQLSFTLAIIAMFVFHEPTKKWVARHHELFWISFGVLIVTMIALACCESVRRKSPMNFIFLALFTMAQSFMLGIMSAVYDPDLVLMAVGITAAVTFGLTIFAFQTKWDFTGKVLEKLS
jgi:protein lifeguard